MFECTLNPYKGRRPDLCAEFSAGEVKAVQLYHSSFPQYEPTPLVSLPCLADHLGVEAVHVKDESARFSLNAFKVLGASYAIARLLAEKTGLGLSGLDYEKLLRSGADGLTFATTTDGNHGRGVAWTAKLLGQKAVVNMPKGTVNQRVKAIEALGATVTVTDMNYDDTVRYTAQEAEKYGWIVVQDTAWPGYEKIPLWIMKGYATMAAESIEQMEKPPTHVFLQAGVGSMAAGVLAALLEHYKEKAPRFILMEAQQADCFYRSAAQALEEPLAAGGDLATIMAGLACGEANILAWPILQNHCTAFLSATDRASAFGMRILGSPLAGDRRVISGESGAVGAGVLYGIMRGQSGEWAKNLALDRQSRVLLFSTEGATDEENYRKIVWEGKYSLEE